MQAFCCSLTVATELAHDWRDHKKWRMLRHQTFWMVSLCKCFLYKLLKAPLSGTIIWRRFHLVASSDWAFTMTKIETSEKHWFTMLIVCTIYFNTVMKLLPVIGIISWYNGCAPAIAWIEIKSSTKQLVSGTKSRGWTSICNATVLWLRMSWK